MSGESGLSRRTGGNGRTPGDGGTPVPGSLAHSASLAPSALQPTHMYIRTYISWDIHSLVHTLSLSYTRGSPESLEVVC